MLISIVTVVSFSSLSLLEPGRLSVSRFMAYCYRHMPFPVRVEVDRKKSCDHDPLQTTLLNACLNYFLIQ